MSRKNRQVITAASITLAALLIDQVIKIWVKTNMYMHEVLEITPWFKILFTENRGMAFGMELMDKLLLTSFRIVAVCFMVYWLIKLIRRGVDYLFLICMSLILAGGYLCIYKPILYNITMCNNDLCIF